MSSQQTTRISARDLQNSAKNLREYLGSEAREMNSEMLLALEVVLSVAEGINAGIREQSRADDASSEDVMSLVVTKFADASYAKEAFDRVKQLEEELAAESAAVQKFRDQYEAMRKAEVERAEEFSRTEAGSVKGQARVSFDSPLEANITVRRSLTQLGGGDRESMEKELAMLRETLAGYSQAGFNSVNEIQRQIQVLETQRAELESQITEVCNLIAEGTGNNIAVTSIQDLESAIRQLLESALGAETMSRNADGSMRIRGERRTSMLGKDGSVLSVAQKAANFF